MVANSYARPRAEARPGFFRQGLLILLPVLLLAAVGGWALWQDRRLAETEARERAQPFADDLARRVLLALDRESHAAAVIPGCVVPQGVTWFSVNARGQITFPGPYEPVPEPASLDWTSLNPAQRQRWDAVLRVDVPLADRATSLQEFLRANPE